MLDISISFTPAAFLVYAAAVFGSAAAATYLAYVLRRRGRGGSVG